MINVLVSNEKMNMFVAGNINELTIETINIIEEIHERIYKKDKKLAKKYRENVKMLVSELDFEKTAEMSQRRQK